MKRHHWGLVAAIIALMISGASSWARDSEGQSTSNSWVTGAANDPQRFQRIEKYLRGFDQPMWEVGERYEKLYEALLNENYELAIYHWAKIKLTIENGTMKRPARRASADTFFLAGTFGSVNEALASHDQAKAWQGFEVARTSCMACHVAEGVSYMNDQSIFTELTPHRVK